MNVRSVNLSQMFAHVQGKTVVREFVEWDEEVYSMKKHIHEGGYTTNHLLAGSEMSDGSLIVTGMVQTGPYSDVTPDIDYSPLLLIVTDWKPVTNVVRSLQEHDRIIP